MEKFYGRGNPKKLPNFYNQNNLLKTSDESAAGKLTSKGFLLYKDSLIRKLTTLKSNPGVIAIKAQLIKENVLIPHKNPSYYILTENILLAAASTAARLVHGNDVNGLSDWKHNGTSIGTLLKE